MHRGSTERRRVVTLVMQAVHVAIEKLANVGDAFHLKIRRKHGFLAPNYIINLKEYALKKVFK